MGQYHRVANLDKGEILDPHKLGVGLKLWEQLASHPGTGAALIVLLASASNGAGGGDLGTDDESDKVIGRWRGDRIAFVGDYDDGSSYDTPYGVMTGAKIYSDEESGNKFDDITEMVCGVIEKELDGKFVGTGWRDFKYNHDKGRPS